MILSFTGPETPVRLGPKYRGMLAGTRARTVGMVISMQIQTALTLGGACAGGTAAASAAANYAAGRHDGGGLGWGLVLPVATIGGCAITGVVAATTGLVAVSLRGEPGMGKVVARLTAATAVTAGITAGGVGSLVNVAGHSIVGTAYDAGVRQSRA